MLSHETARRSDQLSLTAVMDGKQRGRGEGKKDKPKKRETTSTSEEFIRGLEAWVAVRSVARLDRWSR